MAPERINPTDETQQRGFDVRSDVWSLGITMVEIATGRHPYDRWKTPFEQLKQVVEKPPPRLPNAGRFTQEFNDFVSICLMKDYKDRPKYMELLEHTFVRREDEQQGQTEMAEFVTQVMEYNTELEARLNNALQRLEIMDQQREGGADTPTPPAVNSPQSAAPTSPSHAAFNSDIELPKL